MSNQEAVYYLEAADGQLMRVPESKLNEFQAINRSLMAKQKQNEVQQQNEMEEVMTDNQRLLTRYLAAVGCEKGVVFSIVLELWDEDEVIEMLQYCKENPNASQTQLLRMSSEISSKHKGVI